MEPEIRGRGGVERCYSVLQLVPVDQKFTVSNDLIQPEQFHYLLTN